MHVNADVIRLEVLDDDGRPLPVGVEGNLVATSLVNHAMPLLRYRVGDRGSLLPHCLRLRPFAFPLLGVVTGRAADVLVLADGRAGLAVRAHLRARAGAEPPSLSGEPAGTRAPQGSSDRGAGRGAGGGRRPSPHAAVLGSRALPRDRSRIR